MTAREVPNSLAAAGVVGTLPPTGDYSDQTIILGRLRSGRVLESRRVVHVFPLTSETAAATTVTARCGERIQAADLQWLPAFAGAPCEHCLMRTL